MIYTLAIRKAVFEVLKREGIDCEIEEMEDSKWLGIIIRDNTNNSFYLNDHRNDFVVIANGGRIDSDELHAKISELTRYERIIAELKSIIN